jgi:hypothetical protein
MDEFLLGNIFVYLGAAEIIGGTVMLIIGNKKMKQYSEKLNGLKLGMYCKPNQAGLTLTYKF